MRYSLVKVLLTVSPFGPSFSPQLGVFSLSPSGTPFLPLTGHELRITSNVFSVACRLLNSLASLFATRFLYFQQLAASFAKTPGVGVPAFFLSRRLPRTARRQATLVVFPSPFGVNPASLDETWPQKQQKPWSEPWVSSKKAGGCPTLLRRELAVLWGWLRRAAARRRGDSFGFCGLGRRR
jgi:hypothetical protein